MAVRSRLALVLLAAIVGLSLAAASLHAAPAAPEPPLNISAANVTGSRGPEGDIVLLNGDVRITRGRTVITAERGRYLRAQGMLYLDDRVRLVDTTTTLTCNHASYSEDRDLLEVSGNVLITDHGATLKAPSGTYDRRGARAFLYGGVVAEDSTQIVHADQISYSRDSMVVRARGQVQGEGKKDKLRLKARAVDYERVSHLAVGTGAPLLELEDDKGKVARIRATTLKLNTETRIAEAIDSVHVDRDTMQATGRYAVFDDKAERGWLYGNPKAWDNETTVTGDTLEVWTEKRELRRFVVRSHGVLDYKGMRPGSEGETSRMTGQRLDMFFTGSEMDSLRSMIEAQNEYQSTPKEGKTAETNTAKGDTITVYFKDRKIDRAVVRGKAEGEYHMATAKADTAAAKLEVIKYNAARIEFQVPHDRIILDPAAQLYYRDLSLSAKRVEFDSQKQILVASGTPQLVDRGDRVEGHLMTYDLEARQGTIYQAETQYERGLYHGERIRKVGDDELDVSNGSYSTCQLDPPHYHFQSRYMKIFLKDKLVAKPVVFYIEHVPLLALPFWIFPVKSGRHSGFLFPQFELGLNNRAGQFVRNAGYYWAPNDYMDLTVGGDYYQADPSWVLRADGNYKLLYKFEGNMVGTFARNERDGTDHYDFNMVHDQDLTPRTKLQARAEFVSDRGYRKSDDFGTPLSQRLDRFLTSNFSIFHTADWATFSMVFDQRQNIDADEALKDPDGTGPLQGPAPGTVASVPNLTQQLPNIAITLPTRTIGSLSFLRKTAFSRALAQMYLSFDARYLAQTERRAFVSGYQYFVVDSVLDSLGNRVPRFDSTTTVAQMEDKRWGVPIDASLHDSRRLFGWLNFSPGLNTSMVLFDVDNLGNKVVPTATWNANVSTSANFYGTSRAQLGPIRGIRHVLFPSASFTFSPSFENLLYTDSLGIQHERFTGFDGIGISGFRQATMHVQLDQRLQMKIWRKDHIERLDNLLQLTTSSNYNFLWREQGQQHAWTPFTSSLRIAPPGTYSGDVNWVTDWYSQRPLRSLSYNLQANLSGAGRANGTPQLPLERRAPGPEVDVTEPWSLGLAYSYTGGYGGPAWSSNQTLSLNSHFSPTSNWRVDYSAVLDVTGRSISQRFGLVRDLHCWQASFTRNFVVGGETEYYFRLAVKDQKELYLERGNRNSSFGGVQ
jgi:lipopolysaccharide assembly outer membrane protein LptD (OstA)